MSFSKLPYELQEAILTSQTRSGLKRLCLVSKLFLEIARPLLYRSLKITFYSQDSAIDKIRAHSSSDSGSEEEEDEEEEGEEEEDSSDEEGNEVLTGRYYWSTPLTIVRQAALLETFDQHSDWKLWVKTLEVFVEQGADKPSTGLVRIISSFSNLQRLKLNHRGRSENLNKEVIEFLVVNCPKTIRSLSLAPIFMNTDHVLRFLRFFPNVESLSLPNVRFPTSIGKDDDEIPSPFNSLSLPRLQLLAISHPVQSLFDHVAASARSLATLKIHLTANSPLDLSKMSSIRTLALRGPKSPESEAALAKFVSQYISIFDVCTSLRSLKIIEDRYRLLDESYSAALASHRVLHHLPPTLQSLSISSRHFKPSYLLDWITSTASLPQKIEWLRFAKWAVVSKSDPEDEDENEDEDEDEDEDEKFVGYDIAEEEKVEEICRERQIHLTWLE